MVGPQPPALALRAMGIEPSDALLPAAYQAARAALAEVVAIDECKGWADRAEALRSYARQADDPTLLNHAMRIKARAVRRCGELLADIAPGDGGRPPKTSDGTVTSLTRKAAAADAGLSERQRNEALRVAAVPAPQFEAAVEAVNPATVTQLANMGRKPAPQREQSEADVVAFYLRRLKAGLSDDFLLGLDEGGALRPLARQAVLDGPREDRARIAAVAAWLTYLSEDDDGGV